jgi:hypothetical protein
MKRLMISALTSVALLAAATAMQRSPSTEPSAREAHRLMNIGCGATIKIGEKLASSKAGNA